MHYVGLCILKILVKYYIAVEQRYQAYLSSLAENGIPIRDDYIYIGVEEHQIEENGYHEAMKLHSFLDSRVYAVEKYDHYPNIWPIEKDVDNADGLINNDVRLDCDVVCC